MRWGGVGVGVRGRAAGRRVGAPLRAVVVRRRVAQVGAGGEPGWRRCGTGAAVEGAEGEFVLCLWRARLDRVVSGHRWAFASQSLRLPGG